MKYISVQSQLPPEGVFVHTKIVDQNGERNISKLKWENNLWFCDDGAYVYYTPTHWAHVERRESYCRW